MLTKEVMQQINDEEKYRQEIKKELETLHTSKQKSRVFEFLNSTFFLALLSTFVIPILISNYQEQDQKLKEKQILKRKISNERAEIKNRIDIILRIDTSGVFGQDFAEIKNAFIASDTAATLNLNQEFAKRNIFSLLSDYKFDLEFLNDRKATDSLISKVPIITDALQKSYTYLQSLLPFKFGNSTTEVIELDKNEALKNPSKVDVFTSGNHEMNYSIFHEILPELKTFQ